MSSRRRLVITIAAQRDIDGILLFDRRRWGNDQRRRYGTVLRRRLRLLVGYPERGLAPPALYPDCGSPAIEARVASCCATDEQISIGRILRGNRNAAEEIAR